MRHAEGLCDCPLASGYCVVQTQKREVWFEAIEGGFVEDLLEAIEAISGEPASRELLVVRDEKSRTALHLAAELEHEEMVTKLLEIILQRKDHSNIINLADPVEGMNPLLAACKAGNLGIVTALCEAGAKWYVLSHENKQCRDYAEEGGFDSIVQYFASHRAEHHEETDDAPATQPAIDFSDESVPPSEDEQINGDDEKPAGDHPSGSAEHASSAPAEEAPSAEQSSHPDHSESPENEEEALVALPRDVVDSCAQRFANVSFFALFDMPDQLDILQHCRLHRIEAGSHLVRPVPCHPYMMLVRSGHVHVTMKQLDEGMNSHLSEFELEEGDTYGEAILLLGDEMATKFSSPHGCTLVELTFSQMKRFLQSRRKLVPDLGEFLALHASSKTRGKAASSEDHMLAMEMAQRIEARYAVAHHHGEQQANAASRSLDGDDLRPRRARTIPEIPIAHYKVKQGVNCAHLQAKGLEQPPPPSTPAPPRAPSSHTRAASGGVLGRLPSAAGAEAEGQGYLAGCEERGVAPKLNVLLQLREARMHLSDRSLGPSDAAALGQALRENRYIRVLDMGRNLIGDRGAAALLSALVEGGRVETLRLQGNRLGRGSAQPLRELVEGLASLRELVLANNAVGDRGAVAVAEGLSSAEGSAALETLDLANNGIGNAGAKGLGEMLPGNEALTELDLTWNHVSEEGSAALLRGVQGNSGLQALSLGWNRVGKKGGLVLGEVLKVNQTLRKLDLSNCGVVAESAAGVADGLMHNSSVAVLKLDWNPLKLGVPALMTALTTCPAQPLFSLDNCQFDILASASLSAVDERNPSGRYQFDLAAPADRKALQPLLELGMKELGANWRNEELDGRRFAFPQRGAWAVPDRGTLRLDFVHLDPPSDKEPRIAEEDVDSLLRQLSKVLSSPGRLELIRQAASSFVFSAAQVVRVLSQLFRAEERVGALVHLYARMLRGRRGIQEILLKCFRREDLPLLQHRIGPALAFDEARPDVPYRLDLAKPLDREVLGRLLALSRESKFEGRAASFSFAEGLLSGGAGPEARAHVDARQVAEEVEQASSGGKEEEAEAEREGKDGEERAGESSARAWSGVLSFVLGMELSAGAGAKGGGIGSHLRRRSRERSVVGVLPAGLTGDAVGPLQKLGTSRRLLHQGSLKEKVQGMMKQRRGEGTLARLYAEEKKGWKRLAPMPRTLEQLDAMREAERARLAQIQRREANAQKASRMISAALPDHRPDQVQAASPGAGSPEGGRGRGQAGLRRALKPWEVFQRVGKEDFRVREIRMKGKTQLGRAGLHEVVRGKMPAAACVNFRIDLKIPILVHTIPRMLSFSVAPGGGMSLYANVSGLPRPDDCLWKGALVGEERVITVLPSDEHYLPGYYHISVVTDRIKDRYGAELPLADYEFTVDVRPYAPVLRETTLAAPELQDEEEGERSEEDSEASDKGEMEEEEEEEQVEEEGAGDGEGDAWESDGEGEGARGGARLRGGRGGSREEREAVTAEWRLEKKRSAAESYVVLQQLAEASSVRLRRSAVNARVRRADPDTPSPSRPRTSYTPADLPSRPHTSVGWDDRSHTPARSIRPGSQPLPPLKHSSKPAFVEEKGWVGTVGQ